MNYIVTFSILISFFGCKGDPSEKSGPKSYELEQAFPNLSFVNPVDLQNAGDGTNRLFVVEQSGRILVFANSPFNSVSKVFLDIQTKVNSGGEEGLLGLAFHPQYKTNGYFYVNYTAANPPRTIIGRYKGTANPDSADAQSELTVLTFSQPFSNHNGGQLVFGPDNYLYIATGDGGSGGDPFGNGQSLTTLLGKMLRIDVDNAANGNNYAIPADNPFAGSGNRQEIYAYGLRNPWRFSFDRVTKKLWAADVGQNLIEEIDLIEKGKNYGWNIMEGLSCYNSSTCDTTNLVMPIWQYTHAVGQSVTGGFVYRGNELPSLVGQYVYADYVTGRIWTLRDSAQTWLNREIIKAGLNISSFGVDQDDELYLCDYSGRIYRFQEIDSLSVSN